MTGDLGDFELDFLELPSTLCIRNHTVRAKASMKPAQRCRVVSFSCRYRESTTALQHDVPLFGDRVDIIGYLIDGIYIRHENSQISIIPERERGEEERRFLLFVVEGSISKGK